MIPSSINQKHILQAIEKINVEGVPKEYQSTKFDLLFEGKMYPPKYVISLAHIFVNGKKLTRDKFSGGIETNDFLTNLGFQIVDKEFAVKPLNLYEDYTREEVQKVFAPNDKFTRGAGSWGISGIVSIPNRVGDFVFFVTYGQTQGQHTFDEGITEDGVLSWQSQPNQTFNSPRIKQIINHNELKNTIYLFLRTKEGVPYTYLGTLRYLSHDSERERPVYFQGQIIEGSIPLEVCERIELVFQPSTETNSNDSQTLKEGELTLTAPPSYKPRKGTSTSKFRARKVKDYSLIDARNKKLGDAGELLVLKFERNELIKNGRKDLAEKVRHVSQLEGDGAGYDIESYSLDGTIKYVEVKTTKGSSSSSFFMSSNEINFAKQHEENYYLFRVYEYDFATNSGKFFVVNNSIDETLDLTPTQFLVSYIGI